MKARALTLLFVVVSLFLVACGGDNKPVNSPSQGANGMDDALALLPGSAIAVGTVDARAFFSSATFGADLSKLIEQYLPIGAEAGFAASKDVDRVTWASYSYSGIDVAAVIIGRFDEAKIKAAAQAHTATKTGNTIVASQYLGRDVYTVSNVGFTVLGPTRVIAGTESGIRRVLERIKDNRVNRDITKWMLDTVETSGAASAVAADFATQPMPQQTLKQLPVAFLQSMKQLRVLVTFKDPGMQIAGAITYADAATATTQADQVKQLTQYTKLLALIGVNIQNIDVKTDQSDVDVKLEVDDKSLRSLLQQAPQYIGPPPSGATTTKTTTTTTPVAK